MSKPRYGLSFDGVDDWVSVADDPSLNFGSGDFTIVFWGLIDSSAPNHTGFVAKGAANQAYGNNYKPSYIIRPTVDSRVAFYIEDGTNHAVINAYNLWDNQWHFYAGVRDGNTLRFYIDGVEVGTADITGFGSTDNTYNLVVGRQTSTGSNYLLGDVDEIRIYNRALSDGEIETLYQGGEVNDGLVLHLHGDDVDVDNDFWFDRSGYGNSGTLNGPTLARGHAAGPYFNNRVVLEDDSILKKPRYGLNFDGTDDYTDLGLPNSLKFGSGEFTVAVLVKVKDTSTNHQGFVSCKNDGRTLAVGDAGWVIRYYADYDACNFHISDGTNYANIRSQLSADNNWHFYVGVRKSDVIELYRDGVFVKSADASSVGNVDPDSNIVLGRQTSGGGVILNGAIAEVRVYNRALSDTEIQNLYNEKNVTDGLVLHLYGDDVDVDQNSWPDRSGYGNNGTLYNGPTKVYGNGMGHVHVAGSELLDFTLELSRSRAHNFTALINNSSGDYTDYYGKGYRVTVWVDSPNFEPAKVLTGQIEEVKRRVPSYGVEYLEVSGLEYFNVLALNRVVAESYRNEDVADIVKDLISKYASDIDASGISSTSVTVPDVRFAYKTLRECLDQLATLSVSDYHCTPELVLEWYPKRTESSGLTLTADSLVEPELFESLIGVRTRVWVIGGVEMHKDQAQETTSGGSVSLADYYYAIPFTPSEITLEQIALYLSKTGNPVDDLLGEIVEDNGGLPTGALVASFRLTRGYIGSAAWRFTGIEERVDPSKTYWIILYKTGDASNTYNWYHDGGASGTYAYSSDGSSWTKVTGSFGLAYRTYYSRRIVMQAEDDIAIGNYSLREVVIQEESLRDIDSARAYAQRKLEELSSVRKALEDLQVRTRYLSSIPDPGKTVNVDFSPLGLNEDFILEGVELNFREGGCRVATLSLGDTAERVEDVIRDLLQEGKDARIKRLGLDKYITIHLVKAIRESLALADSVSATEKGVFTIESSLLDGDDRLG